MTEPADDEPFITVDQNGLVYEHEWNGPAEFTDPEGFDPEAGIDFLVGRFTRDADESTPQTLEKVRPYMTDRLYRELLAEYEAEASSYDLGDFMRADEGKVSTARYVGGRRPGGWVEGRPRSILDIDIVDVTREHGEVARYRTSHDLTFELVDDEWLVDEWCRANCGPPQPSE